MKIGTITYWWSQTNYGQVLQCYALVKFLRMRGHDAFLIKYNSNLGKNIYRKKLTNLFAHLVHPFEIKHWLKTRKLWKKIRENDKLDIEKNPRHFDVFKQKYIPSTLSTYTYPQLVQNPPYADAYFCGSDQIWGSDEPPFFLQFGSAQALKIAYAPSFGGIYPTGKSKRNIIKYLKQFSFLSSREQGGIDFLKSIGFEKSRLLPDPTLLLSADIYRQLETNNIDKNQGPYVLVYLLGNPTEITITDIQQFAKQRELNIRYVAAQGKTDEYEKIYPTIEEWLEYIDKAQYVITNSFHGTVFSLLMNTPFLTLPIIGELSRMNNRISDLLSKYNLDSRICQHTLNELLEPIDFTSFNNRRKIEEFQVIDLLSKLGI